jgi:hypothetical protein
VVQAPVSPGKERRRAGGVHGEVRRVGRHHGRACVVAPENLARVGVDRVQAAIDEADQEDVVRVRSARNQRGLSQAPEGGS